MFLTFNFVYDSVFKISSFPENPDVCPDDPNTQDDVTPEPMIKAKKSKPKRVKKFQKNWLTEFEWLVHDNDKMFCNICLRASSTKKSFSSSIFVVGCTNMQRSTLSRHQLSDDHCLAKSVSKQQIYMAAAKEIVNKKHLPVLEAQIKTAIFLAQENLPNRKFIKLIDLQLSNGSTAFDEKKGILTNHQAASTFQEYAANVLRSHALVRIKNSPFIGIMLDESLDIAVNKKLVLFCKILHNGDVKIEFAANITINDGKAETVYNTILNFLNEHGIDVSKLSGLGSDGASVMMGKVSGVGVRMKALNNKIVHIWCAAHRVALVSFWAAKTIPYLQTVNDTIVQVYTFYQYSAPRYQKLRELQNILGKKVKRFKKPTSVRWLSLSQAVSTLFESFSPLVISLEHEQASNSKSDGSAKAKGILKKIKNAKFLITLAFLKDILAILDRVSKLFQGDNLNIHVLKTTISSTVQTLESFIDTNTATVDSVIHHLEENEQYQGVKMSVNLVQRRQFSFLKRKFIQNLVAEFENRFPQNDMNILDHFNKVLNPKLLPGGRDLGDYGLDSLEFLIETFTKAPPSLVKADELRHSFLQLKYLMNVNRELDIQGFCLLLVNQYKEAFPEFVILAQFLLTCPLTSVPCERGFSLQNRHHAASSSRRTVQNVENRMFIEYASKFEDMDAVAREAAASYARL